MDAIKPNHQEYAESERDLSRKPLRRTIESGIVIVIALLLAIPIVGLAMLYFTQLSGQ
jgi:hypothetical protein